MPERDISQGSIIKKEDIEELNPQTGITLLELPKYKNKRVKRDIFKGEVIEKSHFLIIFMYSLKN